MREKIAGRIVGAVVFLVLLSLVMALSGDQEMVAAWRNFLR